MSEKGDYVSSIDLIHMYTHGSISETSVLSLKPRLNVCTRNWSRFTHTLNRGGMVFTGKGAVNQKKTGGYP
jgi:hypothetical protein